MRTTGNSEKMLIKNALKWQRMARLAWKMGKELGGEEVKGGKEEGFNKYGQAGICSERSKSRGRPDDHFTRFHLHANEVYSRRLLAQIYSYLRLWRDHVKN